MVGWGTPSRGRRPPGFVWAVPSQPMGARLEPSPWAPASRRREGTAALRLVAHPSARGGAGWRARSRAARLLLESTSVREKVSWLSVRSRFGAGLALFASLSPARFFPDRRPKSASSQLMQSRASPGWGCSRRGKSFITDGCSQASCSRDPSGRRICPTSYLSLGARLCMGLNTPLASVEADLWNCCRFHALSIHICIESVSSQTPE